MSLQHSILGLLGYEPMTGYDIKRFLDNSLNFVWTAQSSQIYRELHAMEKKGLIFHEPEAVEGRMDRKVYHLTDSGSQEFTRWLQEFPDTLSPTIRDSFAAKVFFGSQLPLEEIRYQINRYIREKETEVRSLEYVDYVIDRYSKRIERQEEAFYWDMLNKRNKLVAKTQISWAQDFLVEVDRLIETNNTKKST